MTEQQRIIIPCRCGHAAFEATAALITCLACYCDDCQAGSRQIEALPDADAVRDAGGGTAYVVYRRDRVACVRGADLLQRLKLKANSATTRVVATCCNSAMAMTFDDRRHWVPMYRARFQADAPPLQMRVATKFKPAGVELPTDVPSYPRFPPSFIGQLLAARLAMFLRR